MTPANTISSHFEKEKDLIGKKKKIEITNEMLISKRIKKKKRIILKEKTKS